jgi:hypothetical protein
MEELVGSRARALGGTAVFAGAIVAGSCLRAWVGGGVFRERVVGCGDDVGVRVIVERLDMARGLCCRK